MSPIQCQLTWFPMQIPCSYELFCMDITSPLRGFPACRYSGLVGTNFLVHRKKGRLRCHKRPKSREETPKEGSDSGWGECRYRLTYLR